MRLWLLAKICVRSDGQVERVSLIRGADGTLDPLVLAMLKTWRYRPVFSQRPPGPVLHQRPLRDRHPVTKE